MVYVLLLRGVNVGGKNKVSMSDLKEALSNEGFEDVSSYINSGNLFFRSTQRLEHCSSVIAHLLARDYTFPIPFVLMNKEDYLAEKAELPDWWQGDLARRDVLFIPNNMDKASILDFINTSELYNEVVYIGRNSIFWGKYDEAEYLKSTYHKMLIKQDFYKHITIRNGKTYDKIADILQEKG
ncbi:MAG: DUF1697 domain-containing protein [Porphyromonas sp.]